jgi:DNA primase
MAENDLHEILDKLDMVSYLDREGVEYRETNGSSGDQLNVRTCPKCGGSKWKVFLNAESGLGNCFHGDCESKYNKYTFIEASIGLSGRSLIEYLKVVAHEQGWRPPRKKSEPVDKEAVELILPKSIPIPYKSKNLAYLENRNITSELASYFHLRYCIRGWFAHMVNGEEKFINFNNRVLIPIFDMNGKLVSFQGRDITGSAERKYLFPSGFASTGAYLYNAHNVKDTKRVLVGEGVFDVMAQKIALDEDEALRDVIPIGTFGKHLSASQLEEVRKLQAKGVEEVTFMWDAEKSAIEAAVASAEQVKGLGLRARIAILPKGKDPNEVPTNIVRQAYWEALPYTLINATRLLMLAKTM